MDKEITIDEGFGLLQDILGKMDQEGVSIEDSFKLYNDGINIVQLLNGKLDDAEKKINIVNEESEGKK